MAEGEQGWVILGGQNMAIHYVAGDYVLDFRVYDASLSWRAGEDESAGTWAVG